MDRLGFGAFVPQGWKMELAASGDAASQWAASREVALAAEDAGYDSLWVYDHFHTVPRPSEESVFECWTTLAALAEATSRIRLGQMVSATPYRNPALTAKIVGTLDVVSGGRVDWGVGAGWYQQEFEAYGYAFPPAGERLGMLEEAVQVVKAMWTRPAASFEGRHYRIEDANCDPKPLQDPHPPVWIGGGGERRTLRIVAEHADCSNWGGKPDEWAHKVEVLERHCAEVGRDPATITKTWHPNCLVVDSEDEARERYERGELSVFGGEPYDSFAAGNLVGTPEQVAEQVRTYAELGCSYFVPWFADAPSTDSLHRFAEEVVPRFR